MRAYQKEPLAIKALIPAHFAAPGRHGRKHLAEWVTNALGGIQPWTRTLADRLARTWRHNPHRSSYAHAKERGAREAQLRSDLARIEQTRHFVRCLSLPDRYKRPARAVMAELRRLLDAGDWHSTREWTNRQTGERLATIYLPEDTWSAQTALAWCVAMLGRLLRAVDPRAPTPGQNGSPTAGGAAPPGASTTESATPAYRPCETETGPEDRSRARRGDTWATIAERVRVKHLAEQPELPATR